MGLGMVKEKEGSGGLGGGDGPRYDEGGVVLEKRDVREVKVPRENTKAKLGQ